MCVCVCAHTQSLRTGTDESARLQPCSVQCIMGFQSLSLSLSASLSLSSSLRWHSVRGGCPRLLSGERRVNSHTHALCPHTCIHTMQKKPHDDNCRGSGCPGNSIPSPPSLLFLALVALCACPPVFSVQIAKRGEQKKQHFANCTHSTRPLLPLFNIYFEPVLTS